MRLPPPVPRIGLLCATLKGKKRMTGARIQWNGEKVSFENFNLLILVLRIRQKGAVSRRKLQLVRLKEIVPPSPPVIKTVL
jgi:hypothetical protein